MPDSLTDPNRLIGRFFISGRKRDTLELAKEGWHEPTMEDAIRCCAEELSYKGEEPEFIFDRETSEVWYVHEIDELVRDYREGKAKDERHAASVHEFYHSTER